MNLHKGLIFIIGALLVMHNADAREAAFMLPNPSPVAPSQAPASPPSLPAVQSETPGTAAVSPLSPAEPAPSPPAAAVSPAVQRSVVSAPPAPLPSPVVQPPVVAKPPWQETVTEIHVVIDSTPDIDMGVVPVNGVRHAAVSFVNHGNVAVPVDKISLSPRGHIGFTVTKDTCSKQTLALSGQCTVEVDLAVHSGGPWSLDIALSPFASNPAARTHISGQTPETGIAAPTSTPVAASAPAAQAVMPADNNKGAGSALGLKDLTMVDFGAVEVGRKIIRSASMVNEGPESMTLQSFEVVAVDKSLVRLRRGCAANMKLEAGRSCTVILAWKPMKVGQLSTDLIIRYTGRPGFLVIPVRGTAQSKVQPLIASNAAPAASQVLGSVEPEHAGKATVKQKKKPHHIRNRSLSIITPDLQKVVSALPNVSSKQSSAKYETAAPPGLHLTGVVGSRAIIQKPNGTTVVANIGDAVDLGDKQIKILDVHAQAVDIMIDNRTLTLTLKPVGQAGPKGPDSDDDPPDPTETDASQSFLSLPASMIMPLPNASSR